ncbi:MAG: hypothetical protein M1832_004145 [Thelocarpon impressellum]|nr:MAG: hypothetical protein M1832_004145 [Thelocarpon impressellum]
MLFSKFLLRGGLLTSHALSVNAAADGDGSPPGSEANAVDPSDTIDITNTTLLEAEHRVVEVEFPGLTLVAAQSTQGTGAPATNDTDDQLSTRNAPARLRFVFTHGSIELRNFTWTATVVDPLHLRQALGDMLVEARRRPADEVKSYFRLDARNLTLVFDADPSDSGTPAAFVWGHVIHAISDLLKDASSSPAPHRSYVGKVQDEQAQVLATVAIMSAFIELPSQGGSPAEQSNGDRSAGGAGRRPLMNASWRDFFRPAQVTAVSGTALSLTWSEGIRMSAGISDIKGAVNEAINMVLASEHRFLNSIVSKFGDVSIMITMEPGLERFTAGNLLFAIYEIVLRLMWTKLGPAFHGERPGAVPPDILGGVAWNVLVGAIMEGDRMLGHWSIEPRALGESYCHGRNCLWSHGEL